MTKFMLIRHAMTDSVGKRLSGRMAGMHLNEEGKLQADKLAERLSGIPIKAVYSSPLERAVETALPLSRHLGVQCITRKDFVELEFGEWTNRSVDDIKHEPRFQHFNSFRSFTRIPGGELMLEAQLRIIRGLEELCLQHQNETVAIVSHSDMIKAALAHYSGSHLDLFQRFEISPASVSIIEIYDETARIMLVNDRGEIIP